MPEATDTVLKRASQGEANIAEIARAILASDGMLRVFDPADMVDYLQASPNALDGQDRPRPPMPAPLDLSDQGRMVACVFSDPAHATAFADSQDMLSNGLAITQQCSWGAGLAQILHGRYHGMMLDHGAHSLGFGDGQVRKLYGHVSWDAFVGSSDMYVLCEGASPYILRDPQGAQASAASGVKTAAAMKARFAAEYPQLDVVPMPFRAALEELARAGVTQLVVNNELSDWHPYGEQELAWMREGVTPGL